MSPENVFTLKIPYKAATSTAINAALIKKIKKLGVNKTRLKNNQTCKNKIS